MTGRVDQAQMRRANSSLILRSLRRDGPRSRAQIAAETGVSKATTSTLISDLGGLGLVREDERTRTGSVGRPGTAVSLDERKVFGIGLEINVDYLSITVMDLRGTALRNRIIDLDVADTSVHDVLDRIASLLDEELHRLHTVGGHAIGIGIAAPGVVDLASGSVRFAPNLGWRGVHVATEVGARLNAGAPQIWLENDAKLGVIAEYSSRHDDDVEDLLYLSAEVGVGAGIMAEGRLLRGWSGFAGEVGHLPLDPQDLPCPCGRTGCWETAVGLLSFLDLAAEADDEIHRRSVPLQTRLQVLRRRADAGDARTLAALSALAEHLATGLSVLVDVINPRMVVLGGYLPPFADYLLAPLTAALERRRMDAGSTTVVAASRLGFTCAAQGGARLALERVFNDPASAAPAT